MARAKYWDEVAQAWKYADDTPSNHYKLPTASSTQLGGVTAPLPTVEQTEVAGIDEAGQIKVTSSKNKLDKNLGVANKGRLIYVDENGAITPLPSCLAADLVLKNDLVSINEKLSAIETTLNKLAQETILVE